MNNVETIQKLAKIKARLGEAMESSGMKINHPCFRAIEDAYDDVHWLWDDLIRTSDAPIEELFDFAEFDKQLRYGVENRVGEAEQDEFFGVNKYGESLHDVTVEAQWKAGHTNIQDAIDAHLENMRGHIINQEVDY